MSIYEFNRTTWRKGMSAKHWGETFEVAGVDFDENLVAKNIDRNGSDEINWIDYKEIELV